MLALALFALAPSLALAQARVEPKLARLIAPEARAASGELRVVLEPERGARGSDLPLARLRALGARVERVSATRARIAATPDVLARIAELDGIARLRFPFVPVPADGSGSLVSQSVALTGASALQAAGVTGAGVDVAVVDIGFKLLGQARNLGEIPASAVAVDLTGTGMEQVTVHGTGVAEQLADMAPGARLFLIRFADDVDFEAAVDYVRDHGIRIANLSVNWFGQSYYDDTGPVNELINRSHDVDGVFWSVAAGNWQYRHWRGGWIDEDGDDLLSFAPADEDLQLIAEQSQICVTLNWNQYPDVYGGARTDLDLFVYAAGGALVASGTDRQNAAVAAPPVEQACFARQTADEPYQVKVRRISGPTATLDMTLVSADAAIEVPLRVAAASIVDPAGAHGAFSVGAIDYSIWDRVSPPPNLDWFSSEGPMPDGRVKPDLVAPNRTTNFTYTVALGTSFAAPIVAGAAALLVQQNPALTNLQIRAALVAAAQDLGAPGLDPLFGWGKLVAPTIGASPDSDGDGIPDASDVCPFSITLSQADTNGDGIGDGCQCGDLSRDGAIDATDANALRTWLAGGAAPLGLSLCNVHGPAIPGGADCRIDDLTVLRRELAGRAPGIAQSCGPALPR